MACVLIKLRSAQREKYTWKKNIFIQIVANLNQFVKWK